MEVKQEILKPRKTIYHVPVQGNACDVHRKHQVYGDSNVVVYVEVKVENIGSFKGVPLNSYYYVEVILATYAPEMKIFHRDSARLYEVPAPHYTHGERVNAFLDLSSMGVLMRAVRSEIEAKKNKRTAYGVMVFLREYISEVILADSFFRLR